MGKKKAAVRSGRQRSPSSPCSTVQERNAVGDSRESRLQNGKPVSDLAAEESSDELQQQLRKLEVDLEQSAKALDDAYDQVAVLRSQVRDRDIKITELEKATAAAEAEAASEHELSSAVLASLTYRRRIGYLLGAAAAISSSVALVAVLKSKN